MTDVRNWDRDAGNNQQPVPDGFPEGQDPGSLNDCSREVMAAVKRMDDDRNGTLSSGGAGGDYAVASLQNGLTVYYLGMIVTFLANHENPGAATLNVSGLGQRPLTDAYGVELAPKAIRVHQLVSAYYEPTVNRFQIFSNLSPSVLRAEAAGTVENDQAIMDYSSGEARLQAKGSSGTPAGSIGLYVTNAGGTTSKAVQVDQDGNVGINAPSPATRLQVVKAGTPKATLNAAVVGSHQRSGATTDDSFVSIVSGNQAAAGIAFGDTDNELEAVWQIDNTSGEVVLRVAGNSLRALVVDVSGNVSASSGSTTMTDGFFYIPAAAGAPTGTPGDATETLAALFFDTSNNRLYVHNHVSNQWRSVSLL